MDHRLFFHRCSSMWNHLRDRVAAIKVGLSEDSSRVYCCMHAVTFINLNIEACNSGLSNKNGCEHRMDNGGCQVKVMMM